MFQGVYDMLIEMGFDAERATLAATRTGDIGNALTWLEVAQDTPIETLRATAEQTSSSSSTTAGRNDDYDGDENPEIPGTAASIKCSDCGKLFSSDERAQYHATRTEHTNFEESTEIIKPLTEDEKIAKLQDLRDRLAEKKSVQAIKDREGQKKNELIRRKKGQDSDKIKEELRRKEQLKEVEKRKREKIEDAAAKERVRQQIKETQELRKKQAEQEKAQREGRVIVEQRLEPTKPTLSKTSSSHTETRLQLRFSSGPPLIKSFAADTTLFEVAEAIKAERGTEVTSITMTFPRKVYQQGIDFGQTLKEVGMVPSCALVID